MTSGEVEFLDPDEGSSGPGADPSIPPHGRPPKGSRRLRIDLAVGAVLMLGLFLVARAISHHSAHSATPAASSSVASATSSGATPGSLAGPSDGATVILDPYNGEPDDPARCPSNCTGSSQVPDVVATAVTDVFPSAVMIDGETVTLDPPDSTDAGQLWFRQVEASVGGRQFLLRVQQPRAGDEPGQDIPDGIPDGIQDGIGRASAHVGSFLVTALLVNARPTDVDALARLAHDPRVLQD